MTDLAGKVALITGASSGIGRSIAHALSDAGVAISACSRSEPGMDSLRGEIEARKGRIHTGSVDVRSAEQLRNFAHQTVESFGTIDILVANAGLGIFKPVEELTEEDFNLQIETNLRGVFFSVKVVLPVMTARQSGDIIIISSLAGKNSFATGSAYCASKWGVRAFAHALMLEVRDRNIRVVTICPGSVDTPFFDASSAKPNRENILQADDIADCVLSTLRAPRRAMISEIDIRPSRP